ncbi:hypothetical protein K1719_002348 [Acacia pycnantha]|nr:hypothetical protein K1719_002348 [Acacia pycnantha]
MARVKMTEERMKEMGITIDDVREYRRQRGIEKKEAKKKQREAKNKGDATVSQKRKEPPQVDPNSAATPKNKKQKAKQVKQGKEKVVISESCSSDDKGWKPTPSANGSSDTENDEEENVRVDKTRARLYKKLKRKQRENVAPEAKADYNKTKLEDYDTRGQTVEVNEKKLMAWLSVKAPQAKDTTFTGDEMDKILLQGELRALFGKVMDDALGVLKAELQAVIEAQHISPATSPRAGLEKDGESEHVETLKSVDKLEEAEDGRSGGNQKESSCLEPVSHPGRIGSSDPTAMDHWTPKSKPNYYRFGLLIEPLSGSSPNSLSPSPTVAAVSIALRGLSRCLILALFREKKCIVYIGFDLGNP